jgi:hypothetical protein
MLLFSGNADGSTPPWIASEAVKRFPNGRQVIAPHTGHQIDGPCTWEIMTSFVDTPAVPQIDTSCVATSRRPPFVTEVP